MTPRERHASGAVTAPPRPVTPSVAARPTVSAEKTGNGMPLWEDIYRGASPAQQAELLEMARRQGLLYAHQLPAPSSNGPLRGAAAEAERNALAPILAGQTDALRPVATAPVTYHDAALDPAQREAVAKALFTPDLCLIQGRPGTGKSRVVAEVITQAVRRGERVLFLAPAGPALDRVLAAVRDRDNLFALRCIGQDETLNDLPAEVRGLTFAERAAALRDQAARDARRELDVAQRLAEARRQDEAAYAQLGELHQHRQQLESQLAGLHATSAQVSEEVNREVAAGKGGPLAQALASRRQAHREARERRHKAQEEAAARGADLQKQLADQAAELDTLRPVVEAKKNGHLLAKAWAWWQARSVGDVVQQWEALEAAHKQTQSELEKGEALVKSLAQEHDADEQTFQEHEGKAVAAEVARRLVELDDQIQALRHEEALLQQKWQRLVEGLAAQSPRPVFPTAEAVALARNEWRQVLTRDEERLAFARQWANYLDQSNGTLAARLPGYANVVACTTAALPSDEYFGDAAAKNAAPFDLLILEEAEHVTESEFVALARRARRWVLVGEPRVEAEPAVPPDRSRDRREPNRKPAPVKPVAPAALRTGFFQRLWQQFHLQHVWIREKGRLVCRLLPVPPEQRATMESEQLADSPEVELRIVTPPRGRPTLAEVSFPGAMPLDQAKQFLFRELDELPIRVSGQGLRWVDDGERLALQIADGPAQPTRPVQLVPGVRELVAPVPHAPAFSTCCIEFDRAAGWQRPRAEEWVREHVSQRELGRSVCLEAPHRMTPGLATFVTDLLGTESYHPPALPKSSGGAAPVEFIAIPPLEPLPHPGRPHDKRQGNAPAVKGGAGLEYDLADSRHRDRLPQELRPLLPDQGYVNYLEAQAVVRALAALAAQTPGAKGLSVAALALYPAQVELIRLLARDNPALSGLSVAYGTPAAFRQREFDVVLLSLTRSHNHRAVPYGEGPRALEAALTRGRQRLLLFGDAGNLARRIQAEGPLDHLDAAAAARERSVLAALVAYVQGHGAHPQVFQKREGPGS